MATEKVDLTKTREAQLGESELSTLQSNGPRALPDNPSASGWSGAAVKKQLYKQAEILFTWLKRLAASQLDLGDKLNAYLDAFKISKNTVKVYESMTAAQAALESAEIEEGSLVFVFADDDITAYSTTNNGFVKIGDSFADVASQIDDLQADVADVKNDYETKEDANAKDAANVHLAGAETITGAKTFKNNVAMGTSGSDNSKIFNCYYTINLRGPVTSSTILPGNSGFSLGISGNYWATVFAKRLTMTGTNIIDVLGSDGAYLSIQVGPNGGSTNWKVPYQGMNHVKTVASTDDIATAKSEALSDAASTAQGKVDALATAMNFSNGAFSKIVAALLQVTKMEVVEAETKTATLEDQFLEMLAGNTVAYGTNYVGFVFTKYDAINDFFVGIYNDTLMIGDCTATRDANGKITNITPITTTVNGTTYSSLEPLATRAASSALTDGHILAWDGTNLRIIDGNYTIAQIGAVLTSENDRALAEQSRVAAENARAAVEVTREKILPFPMTTAEYNHIKNDGYYYNVYSDGTYDVTEEADEDAVRSYQYQSGALYQLTDDTAMAQALATISAATDLINSIVFVTAEQWAEYYRLGTLDQDKHYVLDDEEHMKTLCVDIPAAEAERQAFETYRIEHEGYGITRAQLATLNANGVFGVHFATVNGKLTTVVSVYASQALAEAADEEYVFPMQQGVTYALLD